MWDRKQIKAQGKAAFRANYWACVIVGLLLMLFVGGGAVAGRRTTTSTTTEGTITVESTDPELEQGLTQLTETIEAMPQEQKSTLATLLAGALSVITLVGLVLKIFVFNPLEVGCCRFFRNNVLDPTTRVGVVGEGFADFGHIFITLFLRDLFLALWTALLIIPGIMKAYSYTMVPYILRDNPNLSPTQTIALSRDMMRGNRGKAFVMDLSFLGWAFVGAVTFNLVNIFWTMPYYQSSKAALDL